MLDIAQRHTAERQGPVAVDRLYRYAPAAGLPVIDIETPVFVGHAQVVVDIDEAFRLVEYPGQIAGDLAPRFGVRPMHFRNHGLQHRRSRRHFDHGDHGIQPTDQGLQALAGGHGDFVTGALTLFLVQQLDLNLRLPGVLAQIVMAHHAVKIIGPRRAHIGLQRRHLRHLAQIVGDQGRHIGCHRQRRALGHVKHH